MSELTIELDRLIQKAALEGALTQDAVAQFHAVLTKCDAQTDKINELDKALADVREERDRIATQRDNMQKQVLLDAERVNELEEREKKITEMEVREECTMLRIADHQEMFRVVFRNAVVRKEVMTPVEGLKADQYGTSHAPWAQKDTVEEEEK